MLAMIQVHDISLIYELAGAVLLGSALVSTSDREMKRIVSKDVDYNGDMLNSLVSERTNARFGLILLLIGYILPLVFAFAPSLREEEGALRIGLYALLGAIMLWYSFSKFFLEHRKIKKLHAELKRET